MGGKEQPMISCEVLEKPGWWREISLVTIIVLSLGPALPLLWVALTEASSPLAGGFGLAVWRSFVVATAVMLISLLAGIPAGLLSGLYDFPGRRLLLALLAVPLLVPSFLWAIGLSQLRIALGFPSGGPLLGATSAVFAFFGSVGSARQLHDSHFRAAAVERTGRRGQVGRWRAAAVFLWGKGGPSRCVTCCHVGWNIDVIRSRTGPDPWLPRHRL